MADRKISQFAAVTATVDTDNLVLAVGGSPFRITAADLRFQMRSRYYCKAVDQKAEATVGGTFTSGAWQTRDLNTIQWDDESLIASLASNRITLVAGTYETRIHAPMYSVSRARLRLQNITDATTVLVGSSGPHAYGPTNGAAYNLIFGRFTIAAGKALEIQHVCQVTANTYGFGVPIGDVFAGVGVEVYTEAEFWLIG
jgi:hypothetical protein